MYRTSVNFSKTAISNNLNQWLPKVLVVALVIGFSSCSAIFEGDLSNDCVSLTSPLDNAVLSTSNITFLWDDIDDALTYEFQIADPSFDDQNRLIIVDSAISLTSITNVLYIGEFEWSVKAVNGNSETETAFHSFSVSADGGITNQAVDVNSPLNEMIQAETDVSFTWEILEGAVDYTIRVYEYENEVQGNLAEIHSTEASTAVLNLDEGKYIWTIQASDGNTQLSQAQSYTFIIDHTAPSIPNLIAPNGSAFEESETISFSWDSGIDQLTSTVDSIFIYTLSPSTLVLSEEVTSVYDVQASTLGIGSYEWQIVSVDEAGNYSESNYVVFDINE